MVHEGELPTVRFGRSYWVPALAVQDYLVAEPHAAAPGRRHAAP
ncbi:hypothetical protein GCM10009715_41730 [Paeniglutamicibacter psychrophenolicus]